MRQRQRDALGGREAILAVEDHAVAAVEHDDRGAGALVLALRDHQIGVVDVDDRRHSGSGHSGSFAPDLGSRCPDPESRDRPSACRRCTALRIVAARIEIHRVAELVRLRRRDRFDAGRQVPRVVAAGAAAADRAEQIAQRTVAEKVERLVGDLELHRSGVLADAAARAAAMLAFLLEIGRAGDEPLFHHPLDDLLDQILELLPRLLLVAVRRFAEQLLQRLFRQHAAAEERFENRVVQRLHRAVLVAGRRIAPRIAEPARQQQVGQLRDQILEIDLVEQVAGVLRVAVFH